MYGWWVGELNSLIGIVPKEYLTTAFEMEEIWSPGIKTVASKSLVMPSFLCEGRELPVKWLFFVSTDDVNDLPLNKDEAGIVFPKLGTVSVGIRFNDMWKKTQNNNDLINTEIYFSLL